MDRNTLEYMADRTKKGMDIVDKIDKLALQIREVEKAKSVIFSSPTFAQTETPSFVQALKQTFIDVANEEIALLEQELLEL